MKDKKGERITQQFLDWLERALETTPHTREAFGELRLTMLSRWSDVPQSIRECGRGSMQQIYRLMGSEGDVPFTRIHDTFHELRADLGYPLTLLDYVEAALPRDGAMREDEPAPLPPPPAASNGHGWNSILFEDRTVEHTRELDFAGRPASDELGTADTQPGEHAAPTRARAAAGSSGPDDGDTRAAQQVGRSAWMPWRVTAMALAVLCCLIAITALWMLERDRGRYDRLAEEVVALRHAMTTTQPSTSPHVTAVSDNYFSAVIAGSAGDGWMFGVAHIEKLEPGTAALSWEEVKKGMSFRFTSGSDQLTVKLGGE